jgi:hypothetical protein
MKKLLALVSAVALTLTLAACGGESTETETTTTTKAVTTTTEAETATTTTKAADITTTDDDESEEDVTVTVAVTAPQSNGVDITFTQTADTTVVSVTSPAVSQFASQAKQDMSKGNSFNMNFSTVDDSGYYMPAFFLTFEFVDYREDSLNAFFTDSAAQTSYYDTGSEFDEMRFSLDGDTATWTINNTVIQLDKIETVEVYAYVGEDDSNNALLPWTRVPVSDITVGSELPSTGESAGDGNYFLGVDDSIVPDVLKYTVGTLTDVKYTPEGMGAYVEESIGSDLAFAFTNATEDDYNDLTGHYINRGALDFEYGVSRAVVTFDWGYVRVEYDSATTKSITVHAFFYKNPGASQEPVAVTTTTTATPTAEITITTAETTTTTTTTTTAATTAALSSSITGTYRAVEPAYPPEDINLEEIPPGEEFLIYDHINIDANDDGSYQVEFRPVIGGSGNDFAVFDSEALGTTNWYSFYFDGDMGVPWNNGLVTVTADGTTAWVTYENGEPQEFRKIED